jgi:D-alanine--poly(phosphoribitol) ligase subunit 2
MTEVRQVQNIQTLFADKLFRPVEDPDIDLFDNGILDSMALIELIFQLEQTFGFHISLDVLDVDSIRTVRKISHFVSAHAVRQKSVV